MNVTVSAIWIPWLITLGLLGWMLRPYETCGIYDFGPVFRLFWLIPILCVWIVYLLVTR